MITPTDTEYINACRDKELEGGYGHYDILLIVPTHRKSVVLLQKKLNLALTYCNHPSRVDIIIDNPGGNCNDGEDHTSMILTTLQTRINVTTRRNGNYTHNINDTSSKDNDKGGHDDSFRRTNKQLWAHTRYVNFLAGVERGSCLNFGAEAACKCILMFCYMDTPMPVVWDTMVNMELTVDMNSRDKGYNDKTL